MGLLRRVVNIVIGVLTDLANIITGRGPALPPWEWKQETDPFAAGSNSEIDELIKGHMRQQSIKAGQFALFVDGTLRMSSAYTWGESDYPVTRTDHVMRVASCSKAFTTAAILDLLDPATAIIDPATNLPNLRFDDEVFDILFPPKENPPTPKDRRVKKITVEHLLNHTGGWNYRSGPGALNDWVFHMKEIGRYYDLHSPPGKKEFAHYVLCEINLDFDPGRRPDEYFTPPDFQPTKAMDTYSNIGYVLLGMIVEKKSAPFIDYLNTNLLAPLGITDVAVGSTREADRRSNEVFYESSGSGPDATIDPFDWAAAPLPYGGDGSLKEVMDSGGGLIMSANSLAKFATDNNILMTMLDPTKIPDQRVRQNNSRTVRRRGSMPGTEAVVSSFQVPLKVGQGDKTYDMALIFNRKDVSKMDWGDDSNDFLRLVRRLENKVRENF